MITKDSKYNYHKMVNVIISILVFTNVIWVILDRPFGPIIALIFYTFAILLFWRKNDIFAVIIIGVIGFAIHIYEFIFIGITDLNWLEIIFFLINSVFPILLIYFCYKLFKKYK